MFYIAHVVNPILLTHQSTVDLPFSFHCASQQRHQRNSSANIWKSFTGMLKGNLVSTSTFMSLEDLNGLSGELCGECGIEKSPIEISNRLCSESGAETSSPRCHKMAGSNHQGNRNSCTNMNLVLRRRVPVVKIFN